MEGNAVAEQRRIHISIPEQRLTLIEGGMPRCSYAVSTAANGAGEREGSECTPRGQHRVAAKIGAGAPVNAVFVARQWTGEIYTPALAASALGRDWILTRIVWLAGCEPGRNQGGHVDTLARYVYLHGTPDSVDLGRPGSRGCVRMRNADLLDLFDLIEVGTRVDIVDDASR